MVMTRQFRNVKVDFREPAREIDMKTAILLLPLLCLPAYAKTKHAPLPDSLLRAKTVYLSNQTGTQGVLDRAYQNFEKWGRFRIVQEKDAADLVVVFSHKSGMDEGTTTGFTEMQVFAKGDPESVFQTTEPFKIKLLGGSATKSCVEDFRHRLAEP